MPSAAKQQIVRGAVRMAVIAPVVAGFGISCAIMLQALVPLYLGVFAGTVVLVSGGVEVARGVLAKRADQRALPQARIVE